MGYLDDRTTGRSLRLLLGIDTTAVSGLDSLHQQPGPTEDVTVRPLDGQSGTDPDHIVEVPFFGRLNANQLGLPLFTIAIGLVDGLNPCAMWGLVCLLSLLVNLQDRRRMVIVAGTFVAIGGLAYFAFIAAWFEAFMLIGVSRGLQAALGAFALLAGSINVKDFFAFKKGISLSIPESAKHTVYAKMRRVIVAENLVGAMIAAAILAGLINLVELLCTAGLPAIYTQILATQELDRAQYYGYLALYIGAYVLDDSMVLAIAVITLARSKMQERVGRLLKLLSGVVMIGLGFVLLVTPHLLP